MCSSDLNVCFGGWDGRERALDIITDDLGEEKTNPKKTYLIHRLPVLG